ncbi:hypothetical protein E0Z10_g3312 [Xylaria hypoxylon]|uniref:Uncharacterized protein n=1 Tax=Xylaria hypoxylon TaxID=37992 RepID=A0A4Z0Z7V4_9PEZI|nr:hypothetical protein E0Z10_g3312 [Xylaria hypoxylon]
MKLFLVVLLIQTVSAARTRQPNEINAQQRIQGFAGPMGRVATGGPHSLQNRRAYVNEAPVVSNTASSVETGDIKDIDEAIKDVSISSTEYETTRSISVY